MIEEYLSDAEYSTYFSKLNNLRPKIVNDLPIEPGICILDLATGYGYFSIELARCKSNIKIVGIDISQGDVDIAEKNVIREGFADRVKIITMDATKMNFDNESFNIVANFLGLEDIHMTRGRTGIQQTFTEVDRILKPGGYFCFTAMPPEEMETDAQKMEVALFSYICGATWLSMKKYENMLRDTGFRLIRKEKYYTGKKLTSEQAKIEIKFACNSAPKIYEVETQSFEKVWGKFGQRIEKHGLGHYSKTILLIAQKVRIE